MDALFTTLLDRWVTLMFRALIILGPMVLIFWLLRPRWVHAFRIHQPLQKKPIPLQELPRAILGLSVYLIPTVVLIFVKEKWNYSPMYLNIEDYGWPYFFLSIFIFAFFIDTWFYWAHRLMHSQRFLKKCHNVHHKSYNITPVSSYSFDLVEALINMMPFMIVFLLMPWHPMAVFIFSMFGIFYIGYIHLGYDFAYSWRRKHPVLKWFYSSTHHSIHHQRYDGNFAVYFTFWDKWMKTEIEPFSS